MWFTDTEDQWLLHPQKLSGKIHPKGSLPTDSLVNLVRSHWQGVERCFLMTGTRPIELILRDNNKLTIKMKIKSIHHREDNSKIN